MELSKMNYEDALDFISYNEEVRLEHHLKLDVFYCESDKSLLEWLPILTTAAWDCFGITIAYVGLSTQEIGGKQEMAELFFRTDRPITEDEFKEILECATTEQTPSFLSVEHKTMLADWTCDICEEIDYHWSIDSYQDLYRFTNEEMFDIFGKDAGLFSSSK